MKGAYCTDEATGAERNGARMAKINSVPGVDGHQDGALCTVIGSIETGMDVPFGYFVEWDDMKGVAVFIGGDRLRPVSS